MKSLIITVILFFFFGGSLKAQNDQNYNQLNVRLAFYVNELRDSIGLKPLKSDSVLKLAATNHSEYMAKFKDLSHEEKFSKTKTPTKRVVLEGGTDFEIIGENILYENIKKNPSSSKKIDELAKSMFLAWKNSPPHYANMINSSYVFGDFGFAFDTKNEKIYATQLFGKRGFIKEGQLSKDGYGLIYSNKPCENVYENTLTNMGNSIELSNDTVYLNHHSKNQVNEVLNDFNDGIAVDLVFKNQFPCDSDNELDLSSVYDGILLEPIYYQELMSNNFAVGDYRLITPIGVIPTEYHDKEFSVSIIFIVNGKVCDYKYPVQIPSKAYALIDVKPIVLRDNNIEYKELGIVKSEKVIFNFNTNKPNAIKVSKLSNYKGKVSHVSVFSYTSVEGDSVRNEILHNARAKYISNYIHKKVKYSDNQLKIKAIENWQECYFQMELLGLDSLILIPKDSVRVFVKVDQINNWDSLLFEQRKSLAIIHYSNESHSSLSQLETIEMNLRQAIINGENELANKALADLYDSSFVSSVIFEEEVLNALYSNSELTQNAAAYLSINYKLNLFSVIKFTGRWLSQSNQLTYDAKFNVLQLYNLTTDHILDKWDVKSENLVKVLHPSKVELLVKSLNHNELLLNYHLSAISYYGQINDNKGMTKSFDFITNHFKNSSLDMEDEINLCLFFNSWSRFDLTISFLYNRINDKDFNEEAAFILARTATAYESNLTYVDRNKIYKKAKTFNKLNWCWWLKNEFQILRNQEVKKEYCQACQEYDWF